MSSLSFKSGMGRILSSHRLSRIHMEGLDMRPGHMHARLYSDNWHILVN